jgi:hypothetical protein
MGTDGTNVADIVDMRTVAVEIDGVLVTELVGDGIVEVNNGVRPGEVGVLVEDGIPVDVATTGTGVWTKPCGVFVGTGVGKKTPATTNSVSSRFPSSRMIISNAAGFIGATIS